MCPITTSNLATQVTRSQFRARPTRLPGLPFAGRARPIGNSLLSRTIPCEFPARLQKIPCSRAQGFFRKTLESMAFLAPILTFSAGFPANSLPAGNFFPVMAILQET